MSPSDPFFHVHLQFVLCVGVLFNATLFGDVRISTKPAIGPLFANAHKLYSIYGYGGINGFLEVWNKLRLCALM